MSTKVEIMEIAGRLIDCTKVGFDLRHRRAYYRGFGKLNIFVTNERRAAYVAALRELYQAEKVIATSYVLSTFESEVAAFIAPFVTAGTKPNEQAVRAFLTALKSRSVTRHDVFRPIQGVQLTEGPLPPVVLGPFTIYEVARHPTELAKDMHGKKDIFEEDLAPYMIRTHVDARDALKALELADEMFERFERILRYMIAHEADFEVSILNRSEEPNREALVLSQGKGAFSSKRDVRGLVFMDDEYFVEPQVGHDRIWAMLGVPSNSEIGNRLLLAVEWIGQSFAERVPSSAFLKAAIAVEVLFTPQQSEFITPSIASQISESVALVLGTDVAARFALEKEVKALYKIRSGVAHAGKSDVSRNDLERIQDMARQLVTELLTLPSLRSVSTAAELQTAFKSMKYGCPAMS